jgi:molybdopterin-containing oxidoreductase family iron-sulfur binding subunit
VVFCPDASVLDGRFANNGWLQELPDPLTKLTWDNAALVSPQTAAQLGVESGGMVDVTVDGRSSGAVAVFVLPGHADGSITLPLGYGRRFEGRISTGAGFDFQAIRPSGAAGFAAAAVQKAAGSYVLATTQDHHAIDPESTGGRGVQDRLPTLIRAATRRQYVANPGFANDHHHTGAHVVHRLSLWDETNLQGATYGWGMSIDLSACVGCNACIVACQAENNIPIVGKDQVLRGREMHWLRVDRYFAFAAGPDGEPDPAHPTGVALQPVPCMHCENAPCEQVCPVAATVHDKDGLNVMFYNRCIGTRYCSNNCPYKVRRFNYYDFRRREPAREQPGTLLAVEPSYYGKPQAADEPLRQMQLNPEVTVRMRGVMEKCTYCVQRIQAAKIDAKNHWVQLAADDPQRQGRVAVEDGAVMTACQQACPADAIAFGDLADPASRVARLQRHHRAYGMLEEINTKPRTLYLAKLSNPAFGDEADAHHGDEESTGEGGHP